MTKKIRLGEGSDYILVADGKQIYKFKDSGEAEARLRMLKSKFPQRNFELKHEVCKLQDVAEGDVLPFKIPADKVEGNYEQLNYRKNPADKYAVLDHTFNGKVILTTNKFSEAKKEAIEWAEYDDILTSVQNQQTGKNVLVVDGVVGAEKYMEEGLAEGLNEFAQGDFNGSDDSNDLQLYLNVAKKLNMKKYKPSTAHDLIAKKMAELVDAVDDEKVDWARHMARKAQGLPSMLDQQGVAEGSSVDDEYGPKAREKRLKQQAYEKEYNKKKPSTPVQKVTAEQLKKMLTQPGLSDADKRLILQRLSATTLEHRTTGKVLSTHDDKSSAQDELAGIASNKDYKVAKATAPKKEFSMNKNKKQGVAEGYEPGYVKYEQMKDKISSVLIKLYNQGKDAETIKQMGDRVAKHLGYDPTDSIYQDAWSTSFNDASLDGSLNQDSEDDYTDYSMRQGEMGRKGVAEGFDKLSTQQKAHEYNLDAAQKEMDSRDAQGEDMTGATIDKKTYKIVKPKKQDMAEGSEVASWIDAKGSTEPAKNRKDKAEKGAPASGPSVADRFRTSPHGDVVTAMNRKLHIPKVKESVALPDAKLMRNIAEGLVRMDDLVLNRPVYGNPSVTDRRVVQRMVREFAEAGIDYRDAVVELVEYFRQETIKEDGLPSIPPLPTAAPAAAAPAATTTTTAAVTPDEAAKQEAAALAKIQANAGLKGQLDQLVTKSGTPAAAPAAPGQPAAAAPDYTAALAKIKANAGLAPQLTALLAKAG